MFGQWRSAGILSDLPNAPPTASVRPRPRRLRGRSGGSGSIPSGAHDAPSEIAAKCRGGDESDGKQRVYPTRPTDGMKRSQEHGDPHDERRSDYAEDQTIDHALDVAEKWLEAAWPHPDLESAALEVAGQTPEEPRQVGAKSSRIRRRARCAATSIAATDLDGAFHGRRSSEARAVANGTGIGLPLCRQLVTMADGRLLVSSTLGAGSAFLVILPLADEPGTPNAVVDAEAIRAADG